MFAAAKIHIFNEKTKSFSVKVLFFSLTPSFLVLFFSFESTIFLVNPLLYCLSIKGFSAVLIDIFTDHVYYRTCHFSISRGEGQALASSFLLVFGIKFLVKENIPPWGVGENKKRNIRLFLAVKTFYF